MNKKYVVFLIIVLALSLFGANAFLKKDNLNTNSVDSNNQYSEKVLRALSVYPDLSRVEGEAVGIAAQPGDFYLLSKTLIVEANEGDLLVLFNSKKAVYRALAIWVLNKKNRSKYLPLIKENVADAGVITYCSSGCFYQESTVGQFAKDVIESKGLLDR
ncbi:hypothetical protein HOH87_04100 [bacterium]|jgi:hypothetical protein|nr:hypothetical protein [bacterium]